MPHAPRRYLLWLCVAVACRNVPAERRAPDGDPAKAAVPARSAPLDATARARAFCEALHEPSILRRAECCQRAPERILLDECTRWVGGSLRAGALELHDTRVAACRSAMQDAAASCDSLTLGPPRRVAACQGLLEGKLGDGAICRSSLECRASLHCDGAGVTTSGACRAARELGAACSASVDPLASYTLDGGLDLEHPRCRDFCSLVSHRCEATPEVGDSCVASANCARGQRCVAGRCSAAEPRAAGESCTDAPCAAGLRCESQRCAPLARAGQACRSDFDCREGGCNLAANADSGVCGMQCNASLDARSRAATPAMRLPLRPRRAD